MTAPFHSPLVRTAAEALAQRLSETTISAPALPVYSNVLGGAYPKDPMEIRGLLQRQLLEPVLFDQQVRRMHDEGVRLFVEVGPGSTLTSLVGRILDGRPHHRVSLDSSDRPGLTQLAHLLGQTAALGCPVDLTEWFGRRPASVSSVDEWVAKYHRKSNPGPMDWVVDPSGARPERAGTGPSSYDSAPRDDKITVSRRAEDPPARGERIEGRQGSAINSRRATTLDDSGPRDSEKSSSGLPGTARAELLRRHQETMAQWLELQRQQQASFDRALRIQEELMFGEGLSGAGGDGGGGLTPVYTPPMEERSPRPIGERAGFVQPSRPPVAVPLPTDHLRSSSPAPSNSKASRTAAELKASVHEPEAVPPASAQDRVAPAGDSNGVPTTEEFRRDLLQAVFDRTGYPVDMLQEDLPLESGLGIDSIKTVEIFSTLKAYHPFFRLPDQEEEEQLAEFAQLKTLGDIIQAYDERAAVWTEREDVSGNGGSPAAGGAPSEDLSSPDREASPPQRMVLEAARSATSASQKKKTSLTS